MPGERGHCGSYAPKVIEARSGSRMSPVPLGKSTTQQNTPLPPQAPKLSRSNALSPSCICVKCKNRSDLAQSLSTKPDSPNPPWLELVPCLPEASPKPQCPQFCRARTHPSPPVSPVTAAAVSQHRLHCIAAGSSGSAPLCRTAPGAVRCHCRREDIGIYIYLLTYRCIYPYIAAWGGGGCKSAAFLPVSCPHKTVPAEHSGMAQW